MRTRGACPECGRSVLVLTNGELRAHNDRSGGPEAAFKCPGSHWIPEECAAKMRARGFKPHPDYVQAEAAGELYDPQPEQCGGSGEGRRGGA